MNFTSIQAYLHERSEKLDLRNLALTSCNEYIASSFKEHGPSAMKGYSQAELILKFKSHQFVFSDYVGQDLLVQTCIGIYIDDPHKFWVFNLKPIGHYVLETDEAGVPVDSWIWMDQDLQQVDINGVDLLRSLSIILPDTWESNASPAYEYVSYVHHAIALYQSCQYEGAIRFVERAFAYLEKNKRVYTQGPYFKRSKIALKMLVADMVEKNKVSASVIESLHEKGLIKRKDKA